MRNNFEKVDKIIHDHGMRHKDAFRRAHKPSKRKVVGSQRSHISIDALRLLTEKGLVEDQERKVTLMRLFGDLKAKAARIEEKKDQLIKELQSAVDRVMMQGKFYY